MSTIEIAQFACLSDNYGYLVHDAESGQTACIDTPETGPILSTLDARGWTLSWETRSLLAKDARTYTRRLHWMTMGEIALVSCHT